MNNWDIKPTITVVYGNDTVPFSAVQEITSQLLPISASTDAYNDDYPITVQRDASMSEEHLLSVIDALGDHVGNVEVGDWMEYHSDHRVDEENNLWVDVHKGIYYGPNCKAVVYYVSI